MTAPHPSRVVARSVVAVSAVIWAMVAVAPPASAGQLKGFSIEPREGAKASASYPVGSIPGTASRSTVSSTIKPSQCRTLPNCGVVPVTVEYPEGYDFENQEFFLEIILTWDQNRVVVDPGVGVGGQRPRPNAQGNDLDVYIYVKKPDDTGAVVDTEIGRSATALMPEKTKVFGGFKVYDIVVSNFGGANTGFKIDVNFIPAFISSQSSADFEESAATSIGSTSSADNDDISSGGSNLSDTRAPVAPASSSSGSGNTGVVQLAPTSADLVAITGGTPITDRVSFGPADSEFDNALEGTKPSATSLFDEARKAGPAKPVAAALLVFWLGFVPVALAIAAGVALMKKRPISLSFDVGAAAPA